MDAVAHWLEAECNEKFTLAFGFEPMTCRVRSRVEGPELRGNGTSGVKCVTHLARRPLNFFFDNVKHE